MKKLFILALAAMFCMAGFAKSTQEVINEITKSTGAQTITLSKDLIAAQATAMPENVKALLSNLDGGTLVLLSEGTDEQIKTFNDRVGEIDSEAYEAMASFVDESDTIKVFGKCEGDYVTELFIAFSDDEDCALIDVTGKISKEDAMKLLNKDMLQQIL